MDNTFLTDQEKEEFLKDFSNLLKQGEKDETNYFDYGFERLFLTDKLEFDFYKNTNTLYLKGWLGSNYESDLSRLHGKQEKEFLENDPTVDDTALLQEIELDTYVAIDKATPDNPIFNPRFEHFKYSVVGYIDNDHRLETVANTINELAQDVYNYIFRKNEKGCYYYVK